MTTTPSTKLESSGFIQSTVLTLKLRRPFQKKIPSPYHVLSFITQASAQGEHLTTRIKDMVTAAGGQVLTLAPPCCRRPRRMFTGSRDTPAPRHRSAATIPGIFPPMEKLSSKLSWN